MADYGAFILAYSIREQAAVRVAVILDSGTCSHEEGLDAAKNLALAERSYQLAVTELGCQNQRSIQSAARKPGLRLAAARPDAPADPSGERTPGGAT